MAYIIIDKTNRITAASYDYHCGPDELEVTIPEEITLDVIHDYLYDDGEWVHDPLPPQEEAYIPTQLDAIEAQVTYTAMMTDTLLEA